MKSIIQDYKHLKQNMIFLIERSGYKNSYLAEKTDMSPVNFSMKKKRGNWTDDELEKILDIIEDEELEDYFLGKLMEAQAEEETISLEELKKTLNGSKID